MTVKEVKRGINRITGATMYLCEFYDGTPCLMINGVNQKLEKKQFHCLSIY